MIRHLAIAVVVAGCSKPTSGAQQGAAVDPTPEPVVRAQPPSAPAPPSAPPVPRETDHSDRGDGVGQPGSPQKNGSAAPTGSADASGGSAASTGSAGTSRGSNDTKRPGITISISPPSEHSDFVRAIIRRYLKRNMQKFQSCYEKGVDKRRTFVGAVQSQFVIASDGTVVSSTATGFDDNVARCVADVIQHIRFSPPKGGGTVQVNYPLNFYPLAKGE